MDAIAAKLSKALKVEYKVAERLVEAGFITENQARKADKDALTAIPGINKDLADKIRGK